MEEIRCPMCGKLNPPELEICQYCQARLKPLIIPQQPEEQMPEGSESAMPSAREESLPDWLKDLRPEDDHLTDQEETGLEEELPVEGAGDEDWLGRLQAGNLTGDEELAGEGEEPESTPFLDEDTLLERLGEIKPIDESEVQQEDVYSTERELETDWSPSTEPSGEDELPDWLSEVSPQAESQELGEEEIGLPEEPASPQEGEQLPEWLAEVEPAEAEELPAWLAEAGIGASSAETFEADEEASPEEGGDVEEEGAAEEAEEPGEEQAPEETPTWLKELREDRAESVPPFEEPEVKDEEPSLEEAELPDWLADLRAGEGVEEGEAEELPDWLAQGEKEALPEAEEAEGAELPDWLAPVGAPEAEPEAEPETEPEHAPEWLSSLQIEEVEEEVDEIGQGEPPEWLAELEKESSPETLTQPGEESVPPFVIEEEGLEQAEEPAGYPLEEAAEVLEQEEPPEWLAELEKEFSPESISPEPVEEGEPAYLMGEEGLEETEPESPQLTGEEGVDFLESIPEWIAEVPPEEGAELEVEEPELEEAELPSWLEAMRPVESVALDIVEEEEGAAEQVETTGPLAGLSGVLAAESDFARVRKPPAYSVKLHVTESQEARVALLRELLAAEDRQKPLPAKPIITPQYIFRLVIALALVLPIAWAVISGGTLTPLPDPANVPAGALDMRRQIDSRLSTNTPVLVAFDYEAGFSGELDLPSRAVISHMMAKGAFLTLISTSPSGPILAERLIGSLNQTSIRQVDPYTSYANMGYVPGGTAGLLSLARSPQQAVPYTLDNLVIWDRAPLSSIGSVGDFGMVLVITENPDTARAWIEQVQPFLEAGETPLVMVVSAQAEPLVLPYYQGSSRQVQGLVVGFPGGVVYDGLTGQDGLDRGLWDAFSLGMLITGIILILGVFVGLGSGIFTSGKEGEV